jgi:pimeloyl-ACP methyl ester carboxylesterase
VPLLSANAMWEAFATRALFYASYGGADFGECQATMARIGDDGDVDDWCREWSATADRLAEEAARSEAGGHHVSAREGYARAANYYRTSFQPLFGAPVDPRLRAAFEKGAAALASAVRLADPPARMVEIPFEGGSLPGVLAEPRGGDARGTIVYTNGYDSDISEMYVAHVPAAVERGYRILIFDGPGQGRNLVRDGTPIRGDWESVVGPVVDWVIEQPGVDPDRIVLAGWSFGGFLAPRAAAFEPRLAALIADPGQWDQRDAIVGVLPLTDEQKEAFPDIDPHSLDEMEEQLAGPEGNPMLRWSLLDRGRWVHGKPTLFEMLAELATFNLSDVADRIACPTLLTAAEADPVARSAKTLLDALTVERKTLIEFTSAEGAGLHCEANGRRLYHQRVYDWLDETLA